MTTPGSYYCESCGSLAVVGGPHDPDRKPCPDCGSVARGTFVGASAQIVVQAAVNTGFIVERTASDAVGLTDHAAGVVVQAEASLTATGEVEDADGAVHAVEAPVHEEYVLRYTRFGSDVRMQMQVLSDGQEDAFLFTDDAADGLARLLRYMLPPDHPGYPPLGAPPP